MKASVLLIGLLSAGIALAGQVAPKKDGIESKDYKWNAQGGEKSEALTKKGDKKAGAEGYEVCGACHLPSGAGRPDGTFPQLAGQHTTVLLTPSDPYLTTEARTYATWRLHLEAWLCFKAAENDAFSAEADPLLLELLEAIPPRWAVMDVAAPFSATDLGGVVVCRVRIDTLVLR